MRFVCLLALFCAIGLQSLAGPIRLHPQGSRDMPTAAQVVELFHDICIAAGPLFEHSINELRARGVPEHEGRHFEIAEWEINFVVGHDFSFVTEENERVCVMKFTSGDNRSAFVKAVEDRYGEQGKYGLFISDEYGKPIALEISFNHQGNLSRHEIRAFEYMFVS